MPKVLCIASLAVAALVFLLFTLNLIVGIPFGREGIPWWGNLCMMFGAAVVGAFSFLTISECR